MSHEIRRLGLSDESILDFLADNDADFDLDGRRVCTDNEVAVDFFRGCGFSADSSQPIYVTRKVK
jgi:xanthine dehydrogenase molybdopterin-binding subunit B